MNKNYALIRQLLVSRPYHLHFTDPVHKLSWWEWIARNADIPAILIIIEVMKIQHLAPHMSILHWCVRENQLEKVQAILEHFPKLVHLQHSDKSIPLHFVRSCRMLDLLVSHGSNLEAKDNKLYTPLHEIVSAISEATEIKIVFRYLEYTDRHFWEIECLDQTELLLQIIELFFKFCSDPLNELTKIVNIFIQQHPLESDYFEELMVNTPNATVCDACKTLKKFIERMFHTKRIVEEAKTQEMLNQFLLYNR